jgi:hypothetical protein
MGIILALFVVLQAGSGFILSLDGLFPYQPPSQPPIADTDASSGHGAFSLEDAAYGAHFGGSTIGAVYRLLLGLGLVAMAVTGTGIFVGMRRPRGRTAAGR